VSRIIFDPAAEAEVIEAASFYEGEHAGSGARFLESVKAACEIVLEYPEIGERRFGARCNDCFDTSTTSAISRFRAAFTSRR